jgi:predicted DNA-binding protein YlxM (UPF0122 family)
MDNKDWKNKNKPRACNFAPWEYLIPAKDRAGIMRQIRQESVDKYGQDYDECPKRKVCIGKSCLGRPLPWDSPTAKPYLEKLKKTQDIRNGELFIQTDCSSCPIFKSCQSPCHQVIDFIQRDKVEEPQLQYNSKEDILDLASEASEAIETASVQPATLMLSNGDIPWDCLTDRKRQIVEKYLYDQLDFKYIADQLGIINQAKCKYEFYLALNRLAEYGVIRKFFSENKDLLTENQQLLFIEVYFNNKSYTSVANKLNISKQAVQQTIDRVIKQHKLKWPKFVRKVKNKVIYNVPELFK